MATIFTCNEAASRTSVLADIATIMPSRFCAFDLLEVGAVIHHLRDMAQNRSGTLSLGQEDISDVYYA